MGYLETLRMKLKKPIGQTQQKFELAVYNDALDKIDTLAGVTVVATLDMAPKDNLYDGRLLLVRTTRDMYVYNYALNTWEQANIQTPAQISTSQVAMVTEAQRKSLSRVNLLDGTVVFNTTSNKLEIYKQANFTWYDAMATVTWVTTDPNAPGGSGNVVNFTTVNPEVTIASATTDWSGPRYSVHRLIDRTQNGVLWQLVPGNRDTTASNNTGVGTAYSTDNGATWTYIQAAVGTPLNYGAGNTSSTSSAFFIDIDDYAHVLYRDPNNGYGVYVRGTPNASRTAHTWSARFGMGSEATSGSYMDLVVHREGSGWALHAVSGTKYIRLSIAANGTTSISQAWTSVTNVSSNGASIDFRHNGDAKTVQVQPDIYVAVSGSSSPNFASIRKLTYNAGSWIMGSDVSLDGSRSAAGSFSCMYDGTRVVVAGQFTDGTTETLRVYDRNPADLSSVAFASSPATNATSYKLGSCTYDFAGNVYIFGEETASAGGSKSSAFIRWDRTANTWGSRVSFDATTNGSYPSCRRGWAGNRLDVTWNDGTASPYTTKYASITGVPTNTGVQGTLGPVVTITTSTASTATAYGNQRKIDRTQNGVLWALAYDAPGALRANYSTDGGTTWTFGQRPVDTSGATQNYTGNASFFIDLDDYAHVVYKDTNNGYIYYMRGTPNTARTAYTWSAATQVGPSNATRNFPDIIAHREGTGWIAHIVTTSDTSGSIKAVYRSVTISSAGAFTLSSDTAIADAVGTANTNPGYPSIDFNHTGDGKTIAGAPHLYVGWSNGATGSGYGIRFRKATYASGSWTWGTEREIDTAHYAVATATPIVFFDGTRVVITGLCLANASQTDVILHDRDASDPTTGGTITRTVLTATQGTANDLTTSSATYDSAGNVFLFGAGSSASNGAQPAQYRRWVRSTGTLEAPVVFDNTGRSSPYVSARRGYKTNAADQLDFVYTDGTASPYSVMAGKIT